MMLQAGVGGLDSDHTGTGREWASFLIPQTTPQPRPHLASLPGFLSNLDPDHGQARR